MRTSRWQALLLVIACQITIYLCSVSARTAWWEATAGQGFTCCRRMLPERQLQRETSKILAGYAQSQEVPASRACSYQPHAWCLTVPPGRQAFVSNTSSLRLAGSAAYRQPACYSEELPRQQPCTTTHVRAVRHSLQYTELRMPALTQGAAQSWTWSRCWRTWWRT